MLKPFDYTHGLGGIDDMIYEVLSKSCYDDLSFCGGVVTVGDFAWSKSIK